MNVIQELKKGNISVLEKLNKYDKEYTFELIGNSKEKDKILKIILPIMRNNDNWYEMELEIFEIIYTNKEYQEYTFYLLHKEYVKPEDLGDYIQQILNTSWGLDYVLNNLERILSGSYESSYEQTYSIIQNLVEYLGTKKDLEKIFFEKILILSNLKIRELFITISLRNKYKFSEEDILRSFYENQDDFYYKQECLPFYEEKAKLITSTLPSKFSYYIDQNIVIKNLEIFIVVEKESKMELINQYLDNIPVELLKKYKELFELYEIKPESDMDRSLSAIINYAKEDILIRLIREKEISYLDDGSTTRVFRVGDKVIKFTESKHFIDTEKDLFLLAPTETYIIYNEQNKPILVIEIQDYLDKTYNGSQITMQDIKVFLERLEELGFITTDPNNLKYNTNNFGFLKDYHDANLTGFESAEDLPNWFKEKPIVLYDIDLIYNKNTEKKKTFSRSYY